MAAAVDLRAAVALAGRFPALAGVDLSVEQGEVLLVEGRNGAGKTSLLRLCAGLLVPSGGTALVLGCDLRRRAPDIRRRVGLLGHRASLYDDLTVVENLRFAVRAARGDRSSIEGALERLDLTGRLRSSLASRLSEGQRRRVALAVILARRPELWLLDEPHAGLDRAARRLLDAIVADEAARGATVLVASHDPEDSASIADRLVTMGGGRVVSARAGGRTRSVVPFVGESHVA